MSEYAFNYKRHPSSIWTDVNSKLAHSTKSRFAVRKTRKTHVPVVSRVKRFTLTYLPSYHEIKVESRALAGVTKPNGDYIESGHITEESLITQIMKGV